MNNRAKRIGMSIFGVTLAGFSVGLFKMAAFGVDPFQSFMSGLNKAIPISFGTLYTITAVTILVFVFFACKHYIGFATVVNLFLLGYIIDFSHNILQDLFPAVGIVGRVVFLIAGVVLLCFSSAFYIVADLGVSTYDAISLIIANEWKVLPFKYCRILSDFVCVAIGTGLLLLSGADFQGILAVVGFGTIVTAFFMGPLVDFFIHKVARPFLEGRIKAQS